MAEEMASPNGGSPSSLRKTFVVDEPAQLRRRPKKHTSTVGGPVSPTIGPRRGSTFSEYSLNEAKKQFQSSTDDLLLPRPSALREDAQHGASHWHSAPLAFALLPAIGGMFFKNGSSVITDVTLLVLAAIFLNWTIRIPWAWYHSAQTIRKKEEYNIDDVDDQSGDEHNLDVLQTSLDNVAADASILKPEEKRTLRHPLYNRVSKELYIHEVTALLSCFVFPVLGSYLLHSIRGSLSRPSEGLVSNYNLTIFLLASEIRPVAHLVKLIQSRTLHLQRVVNSNPYETPSVDRLPELKALSRRLEELEERVSARDIAPGPSSRQETSPNGKQTASVTTEVRRTVQPDLDALNRAVRRYEKRATLQTMQTESRLLDIEARLADAISLAAAAAQKAQRQYGVIGMLADWTAGGLGLPLRAVGVLASLPYWATIALIDLGKGAIVGGQSADSGRKGTNGKPMSHSRFGSDRIQGRGPKR